MRHAVASLREVVSELALTAVEDRPPAGEIAVVDHLGEQVAALQASVDDAADQLRRVTDVRQLPVRLPKIDAAVAASTTRYWRDLRSYESMAELVDTARSRSIEWRAWQHSVQRSQLDCEPAVEAACASVRAAWREIAGEVSVVEPPPG
ncbi:hypothetical protein [Microbacterium deminutum]